MPTPYLRRVEYLESAGNQWIDTGFVPNEKSKIEIMYQLTKVDVNQAIFGGRHDWNKNAIAIWACIYGASSVKTYKMRFDVISTTASSVTPTSVIVQPGKRYLVVKDGLSNYVNGLPVGTNADLQTEVDGPAYIFAVNNIATSKAQGPCYAKLWYAKIWDDGTLVRDFIPVLDNSLKPALYDQLNGTLHYNKGKGTDFSYPDDDNSTYEIKFREFQLGTQLHKLNMIGKQITMM